MEYQRDCDKLLPLLLLLFRSSSQIDTSILFTGREMKLPINWIYDRPTDSEENEPFLSEYINDLNESVRKVYDFARNFS